MEKIYFNLFLLLLLSGCIQLPQRTATTLDVVPNLDANSIVSSNNGILTVDIAKIPGAVCVPNATGLCDAAHIYPSQFLLAGSKIAVAPSTDTTPAYDSLIDNKYNATANVPFVSPTATSEQLNEIKASIVAVATITPGPNDDGANGFPGASVIANGLKDQYDVTGVNEVYWLSGAEVIIVSQNSFTKVTSALDVTGVGFGANGSTYNDNSVTQQSVWLGIRAVKVNLVTGAPPVETILPLHPIAPTFGGALVSAPTPISGNILDVDQKGMIRN